MFPVEKDFVEDDPNLRQSIEQQLTEFYRRVMGDKFVRVRVISVRKGSAIVKYDVEYEDSAEAAGDLAKATVDLAAGKQQITILNETVAALSVEVNNVTVLPNVTSDNLCKVFVDTYGQCSKDTICEVTDGRPTCVPQQTSYGLLFILAIIIGAIALLLATLVVICCTMRAYRMKQLKKRRLDSPQTSSTDFDAEGYWSHSKNHVTPYGVIGGLSVASGYDYPYYIGNGQRLHSKQEKRSRDNRFRSSSDSKAKSKSSRTNRSTQKDYRNLNGSAGQERQYYAYDNPAMDYNQLRSSGYIQSERRQQY